MYIFANNARSFLKVDTGHTSITITLPSGQGAAFPAPTGGDIAVIVVEDRRKTVPQYEIMYCTGRTADVLQVTRAQEGTTAQDFLAGARVGNRMTAGALSAIQSGGNLKTDGSVPMAATLLTGGHDIDMGGGHLLNAVIDGGTF